MLTPEEIELSKNQWLKQHWRNGVRSHRWSESTLSKGNKPTNRH